MTRLEFTVETNDDGARLDEVLARHIPQVSRMRLREAVDTGRVRVDGVLQAAGWRVQAGQRVTAEVDLEGPSAMTPEPLPLNVVYEEEHFIVVEKPSGMVVHPAGRHRSGTLANALAYHFNVRHGASPPLRPGMVHRLDRATSGLMVVAKTQQALSRLTIAFQNKQIVKRYLALVHGVVPADSLEWEAPIGQDPDATPKWGIRSTGRPGHTRGWVRERLRRHTLLELEPITGRTNQLRLHCAHFGYPIVGDDLFGLGPDGTLDRLFLHAFRLEFPHPITREWLEFEIPLSEALQQYLDSLREQH